MAIQDGQRAFPSNTYYMKRKILQMFGASFYGYTQPPQGAEQVAFFVEQKAFKLREAIHVFSDETKTREVLTIQARQIMDFSAAYDVTDPNTMERVGTLKRKGLASMLRDEWIIMDGSDREIGKVYEDSMALALIRRFLANIIPQNYDAEVNGQRVADFKQNFNPFSYHLNIDFSMDTQGLLDRRLGIATAILLAAIEGRQG